MRARIVLSCAEGGSYVAVAARLRLDRKTVARWRSRFLDRRLDGLSDEPRPGVPRTITDAQVEVVVVRTLEEVLAGSTHWFKRELAWASPHNVETEPGEVWSWQQSRGVALIRSSGRTSSARQEPHRRGHADRP
ncbi:helix-turn-helix domain-containing protein [Nonomuraea aridisoli]|uniref:helix-turn-helix domain-containing protein n=1 Tax=Nonomuraea aridisoli TaxID=2070368 RepID=UPI001C64B65E|nr:helix-turn-helix domain-containing protein [Nonomuraea aridisoli]